MQIFLMFIVSFLISNLCSNIAKKKSRDPFVWFMLGLFFGLFALIAIYLLSPLKKSSKQKNTNITKNNTLQTLVPKMPLEILDDKNYWYYLTHEKKQIGPISLIKLHDEFIKGQISDLTFVWNDTLKNWTKLKDITIYSKFLKKLTN